jgi:hypothetical protein
MGGLLMAFIASRLAGGNAGCARAFALPKTTAKTSTKTV